MKIPTIVALMIFSILIIIGISTKSYFGQLNPLKKGSVPLNLIQSNLTPTSITISWTTNSATQTKLIYTNDKNFFQDLKSVLDDRGQNTEDRNLHFVTLQDLKPHTTYYFKVNHQFLNPTSQFTTPAQDSLPDLKFKPLVGSVVSNLQPISDGLVILEIGDFTPLMTYTSQSGNFILPLKPIYNLKNLTEIYDFNQNPDVRLKITKGDKTSHIDVHLSESLTSLPPIILGEDLDLRDYQSTSSSKNQQ